MTVPPSTTTTSTTTSSQQLQQQATSDDDEGHYANIHDVIDSDVGYHFEFNRPTSVNVDDDDETAAAGRRQRPTRNYEQLDPSVLVTLRQPPAPSVYDRLRLSPPTRRVIGTDPSDMISPTSHERDNPAS